MSKIRHLCDYCGGWDEELTNDLVSDHNHTAVHLKYGMVKRDICLECVIKVYDETLGRPLPSYKTLPPL